MEKYNKLVRDKIPEIIEHDGRKAVYQILLREDYLIELDNKLNEEVKEYQTDKSLEELADILEVIHSICKARGYSLDELEVKRKEKADLRGGFDKQYFLEYVEDAATGKANSVSDMKALKKWGKISDHAKELILNNVYCSKCGNTMIVDYSMHNDRFGILLKGKCVKCGLGVTRMVED